LTAPHRVDYCSWLLVFLVVASVVVIRHCRFGPSAVGHDLGTDRGMPTLAVQAPASAGPDHLAASADDESRLIRIA
jgi:hypothetical protein